MKRLLSLLLCVSCLLSCALAEGIVTLSDVTADDVYQIKTTRKLRLGVQDSYYIQQGSATDGTYGYFLIWSSTEDKCEIVKVDLSNYSVAERTEPLPLEHGNGMTYNPKTDQLIVSLCKPTHNRLTFVDRATLAVTGSIDLPINVLSVAYNEARDQYVVGHYDNKHFSILNSDFNILATYDTAEGTFHNQDSDCDDRYIYLLQWEYVKKTGTTTNLVVVYDWEGNHVNTIPVKSRNEIESIFHTEDRVIISYYSGQSDITEAELQIVAE